MPGTTSLFCHGDMNPTASAQDGQFLAVNVCRMRWVTQGCVHQQNCQGVTHGSVGNQALSYSTLLDGTQREISRCEGNFIYPVSSWMCNSNNTRTLRWTTEDVFGKRILFGEAGLHCPVNSSCWSLFMSCNCLGKSSEVREHQ